jgi:hypothetical protein
MPSGYRVIEDNGFVLAHVYARPDSAIAVSGTAYQSQHAASRSSSPGCQSRRVRAGWNRPDAGVSPQPLGVKPVAMGDMIRQGKLLQIRCGNCRPERQFYLNNAPKQERRSPDKAVIIHASS